MEIPVIPDLGEVENMYAMFNSASAFSQNLSSWATFNVTSCFGFSDGSDLTTAQLPIAGDCF